MIFYRLTKCVDRFSIFTRNSESSFPFLTTLFNDGGSCRNPRSWKTEKGAIKFIQTNFPEWILETVEDYKLRKQLHRQKNK